MKRMIYTLILVTVFASFASAQNVPDAVVKALNGQWTWVSYTGGKGALQATAATDRYLLVFNQELKGPAVIFYCTAYKGNDFVFTTQLGISVDNKNAAYPYKLENDVIAPVFNTVPMATPSIHFRIISKDSIEFTHYGVADDFRLLFVNPRAGEDGCDASGDPAYENGFELNECSAALLMRRERLQFVSAS